MIGKMQNKFRLEDTKTHLSVEVVSEAGDELRLDGVLLSEKCQVVC